jgi:RNA polymerase sigma-70 factor (sigma-E family)
VETTATRRPLGDTEFLHDLFAEHHRGLLRLAGLLTNDRSAAEEAVQEAFARLHAALPRLQQPDASLSYLRATVVNLTRSRRRHLRVVDRHRPEPPADTEAAETSALRHADRDAVLAAIRSLPRRQQECIVLRFYEDLSEAQTAGVLGLSPNSVKTHVQRATAALAVRLEGRR